VLSASRRTDSPSCCAAVRYEGSASTRLTAAEIARGRAVRRSVMPAPRAVTRTAVSAWSRPCGSSTIGTPAASAFTTVPCPPCVTTTSACWSTSRCGALASTVTLDAAVSASGSIAGPVVTIPRTGNVPRAAMTLRNGPTWSWNVDDIATSTSGSLPAGGVQDDARDQGGSSSTGPTYRAPAGSVAGKSSAGEVMTSCRRAPRT
jgi:hypothetical protein